MDVVVVIFGVTFLPVYGLIWLGIRRERLELQRMLEISIRRNNMYSISKER